MEIYNEAIRDLLGCDNSNLKHEIKLTSGSNGSGVNDVTVTNLTTMEVTSKSQVRVVQSSRLDGFLIWCWFSLKGCTVSAMQYK